MEITSNIFDKILGMKAQRGCRAQENDGKNRNFIRGARRYAENPGRQKGRIFLLKMRAEGGKRKKLKYGQEMPILPESISERARFA